MRKNKNIKKRYNKKYNIIYKKIRMTVVKGLMKPIYEFRFLPILANKFYKFEPSNLSEKIMEKEKAMNSTISKFDIDFYKNNKYVFFYYNAINNTETTNTRTTNINKITSLVRFTYHTNKVDANDYNKYYYSNMDTKIEFENKHYNIVEKVSYLQNKYDYDSNIDYSLQIYKFDNNAKLDLFDCNTVRIANLSFYNTLNELNLNNCKVFDKYTVLLSEDNQKILNNVNKIIKKNVNNISTIVEYDKL